MGLDITAYEIAKLVPSPHEYDPDTCYDNGHVEAFAYQGFERSFRGLADADVVKKSESGWSSAIFIGGRCYDISSGENFDFRAGSYGGYTEWRRQLSNAVLDVDPSEIWKNPQAFQDKPFYELIHFADNEGCIGPEAAADLFDDFAAYRDELAVSEDQWFMQSYDNWMTAFELARETGLVDFH